MTAKIQNLVENYDQVMERVNNTRLYGPDVNAVQGPWLMDYVKKLHPRRVKMKVTEKIEITQTTTVFHLAPVDQYLPPFQAGQYVEVFVNTEGITTGRAYSIASSPLERGYYEIAVRAKDGGLVSGYLRNEVKVGDYLETSAPSGNLYYNPVFHEKRQILLAGGSGITPFLSMIREITDGGLDREIHLIYGSKRPDDVPYLDELTRRAALHPNFRFDLVISDPDAEWDGPRGFITAELIQQLDEHIDESTFYMCGPHAMQTFVLPELEKLQIPRKRIRKELIGAPEDITQEKAWPKEISKDAVFTIRYDDKEMEAKASETVLTALEKAGIVHESCCRSGECSICRMKLLSGQVYQSDVVILRKADQRDGYIHVCASYPIANLELAD